MDEPQSPAEDGGCDNAESTDPTVTQTTDAAVQAVEPPPKLAEAAPTPTDAEIAATVEAILFATDTPLPPGKIAQVAELPGVRAVRTAIATLNERYERVGCAFRIEEIGGGFQMLTRSEYHDVIERLTKARSESRLSQAALETLAIIAYRQPILRADVEAIRGVASGEVLRGLLEKGLVKIVGRAEVIGRPMLYGTTRRFLEFFGLGELEDLPRAEELRSGAKESPAAPSLRTPVGAQTPSENPPPPTSPEPESPAQDPAAPAS